MILFNACAKIYGKEQNCKELAALNGFFNGYLKEDKDGKKFLREYEKTAPALVDKINSSESKQKLYAYVNDVANCCAEFILLGENVRCLNEMKFMLKNLKSGL